MASCFTMTFPSDAHFLVSFCRFVGELRRDQFVSRGFIALGQLIPAPVKILILTLFECLCSVLAEGRAKKKESGRKQKKSRSVERDDDLARHTKVLPQIDSGVSSNVSQTVWASRQNLNQYGIPEICLCVFPSLRRSRRERRIGRFSCFVTDTDSVC